MAADLSSQMVEYAERTVDDVVEVRLVLVDVCACTGRSCLQWMVVLAVAACACSEGLSMQ